MHARERQTRSRWAAVKAGGLTCMGQRRACRSRQTTTQHKATDPNQDRPGDVSDGQQLCSRLANDT